MDGHYNHRLSVYCIRFYFRYDLRLAGIRDRIGDAVHHLKKDSLINADNFSRFVHYSEDYFPALRIGISHHCLGILL